MDKIRVFLVDDTAAIRRMLIQILDEDPELEVVGTAADGTEGLKRLPHLDPDIIILDIEMPEMGGLEMLRHVRGKDPDLPVLIFSSLTERGAMVTIEALSLGASDYVTKPAMLGSAITAKEHIRGTLLPKIHALARGNSSRPTSLPVTIRPPEPPSAPLQRIRPPLPREAQPVPSGEQHRVDALVIGVSTGGPNALGTLLPMLPAGFPVPVFIVQHMPPIFTKALAKRLSDKGQIPFEECAEVSLVREGMGWIAAGGYHMILESTSKGVLVRPDFSEPENFCRPSVDVLFRSAATVYGKNLLGVVMTGMGHDGLDGARAIREAGGQVIVQDEATSVVWGMAGYVSQAGYAQAILPLEALAGEILQRVAYGRSETGSVPDFQRVESAS